MTPGAQNDIFEPTSDQTSTLVTLSVPDQATSNPMVPSSTSVPAIPSTTPSSGSCQSPSLEKRSGNNLRQPLGRFARNIGDKLDDVNI